MVKWEKCDNDSSVLANSSLVLENDANVRNKSNNFPKNTAKLMRLPWDKSIPHGLSHKMRKSLVNLDLCFSCCNQLDFPLNPVNICQKRVRK